MARSNVTHFQSGGKTIYVSYADLGIDFATSTIKERKAAKSRVKERIKSGKGLNQLKKIINQRRGISEDKPKSVPKSFNIKGMTDLVESSSGGKVQASVARYAKNSIVVRPSSDGSGMKTAEAWVLENSGGRYSHRDKGYVFKASEGKQKQLIHRLEGVNKEPWQRTFDQEYAQRWNLGFRDSKERKQKDKKEARQQHFDRNILPALREGKPIPKEVLDDYKKEIKPWIS